MKFTQATAHLAIALNDPLSEYTELLRAVREGIDDALVATERKLSRMATQEGHPYNWGGGTFKSLLYGKPGPGGGLEATPAVVAFFLIAYLLDCTHQQAAAKALEMNFAACRRSQTMDPLASTMPQAPPGKKSVVCAKTNERYFGAALVALLSDRNLFDQTVEISVSADLGVAQLFFSDGTLSSFYTPVHHTARPGKYSVRHLYLDTIRRLFDLISQSEPATRAPARKRALTASS